VPGLSPLPDGVDIVIAALIQGVLVGDPVRRNSAKAGDFATATLRVAVGSESIFIGVATFSETAAERLLSMAKGATIAAVGTLELNTWVDRDGQDRRDWRLTAVEILTVYQARRRREREESAQ
jgi:single-stranded DNA-binding protein